MIEDYWIQVLEAHPHYRVIGTQVPVYYYLGDWEIHGRADVLTQHKNGSLHVHEVKSIKNLYHVRRSGRPKPEHVDQLQFYLVGLGVDQGRVDYLDKSAFMQGKDVIDQSFMMTAERSVFTRLVNSARILISARESQSAPSPFPCWLCDYCQHSSICQRDQ